MQTPHFPPDSDLLLKAAGTYHRFLTWPVPYCSISQELLTFIDAELKAPGQCRAGLRGEQGPCRQGVLLELPFGCKPPHLSASSSSLPMAQNLGVSSLWQCVYHI